MALPRYSLCYTTIRATQVQTAVGWWIDRAVHPELLELCMSTDADQPECLAALQQVAESLKGKLARVEVVVNNDLPGTCVKGWNVAAAASTGEVIIAMSDDFLPPSQWDDALDAAAPKHWRMMPCVLKVSDGYNPDLCTLSILTRRRYDRYGYLFYPGYQSMFCDTEFTAAAAQDKVIASVPQLLFEHLHPDAKKRVRDQVDLNHSSEERYKHGQALFSFRKSVGFPIDQGPHAVKWPLSPADVAVYIQAIRDDLCLYEVCEQLYAEGARAFFLHIPDESWAGVRTPEQDIGEVMRVASRLRQLSGTRVETKIERLEKLKAPGLSRIRLETRCRNLALRWVRQCGYPHILVVDGDELWKKGLLARLLRTVNERTPASVFTGMVPVIGLPAYPIDGATDKATIYIAPGIYFMECRGSEGLRYEIPGHDIYHFTAVRRSREEIAAKMRESGHYDDPNYDFEGWIINTLPNIRPGMKDAHMYKPYQVWPAVRAWYPGEVEQLPEGVRPFLGTEQQPLPIPEPKQPQVFTTAGWGAKRW